MTGTNGASMESIATFYAAPSGKGAEPRIIMLYQHPKLPSSRVRVLNLLSELREHGLSVECRSYPRRFFDKLRLLRRLKAYDLVFLQKKLLSAPELAVVRHCSKRLAFDFDDLIFMEDDHVVRSSSKTRQRRFKRTTATSDIIIAGNPVLAGYARQFNPAVEIVPSAVPYAGVAVKDWKQRNNKLVIGWVGSKGNLHHLAIVGDALRQLAQRVDLELRVIADAEFRLDGVTVKNVPWTLESQEQEIAQFDVGIMPLPKNPWTEGKCSYKLLQYMAAEVPVVATAWGFNRTVVQDGLNGFLAEEPEDFYRHLLAIHANPSLAREMGTNARLLVGEHYSIAAVGEKLAALLGGAALLPR